MKSAKHLCPVCGYPKLGEPARSASGGGSYEICPSCGFQFGVDDDDKGITFEQWRTQWLSKSAPWSSKGIAKPKGWDGSEQCAALVKKKPSAQKRAKKKT